MFTVRLTDSFERAEHFLQVHFNSAIFFALGELCVYIRKYVRESLKFTYAGHITDEFQRLEQVLPTRTLYP